MKVLVIFSAGGEAENLCKSQRTNQIKLITTLH